MKALMEPAPSRRRLAGDQKFVAGLCRFCHLATQRLIPDMDFFPRIPCWLALLSKPEITLLDQLLKRWKNLRRAAARHVAREVNVRGTVPEIL